MNFYAKKFDELTTKELYEILKVRSQVFMLEQGIRCLDMDDVDYSSLHLFFEEEGKIISYLRAFSLDEKENVKIGRVLSTCRGKGVGRSLMEQVEKTLPQYFSGKFIFVDAQKRVVPFYEKCGFLAISEEFMEGGILHIKMQKKLS
ncbi:MAG: GNAT family N-acetyltransferase [Clostridia bacterium]|nr:GNAT family N-acetyltransferase [Clostridia bacterium]